MGVQQGPAFASTVDSKSMESVGQIDAILVPCRDLTRDIGALAQALRRGYMLSAEKAKVAPTPDDAKLLKVRTSGWKRNMLMSLELLETTHDLTEELFGHRAAALNIAPAPESEDLDFGAQHQANADEYAQMAGWAAEQPEGEGLELSATVDDKSAAAEDEISEPQVAAVVGHLKQREKSLDFQMKLVVESQRANISSGYSRENFSYGTTPYASWLQLFQLPCVTQAIERIQKEQLEYTVWGSSAGWLAFYGALTFGVRTVGVELLQFLVDEAEAAAAQFCAEQQLSFVCRDMLEHELSNCGLLMLTSQCWDRELIQKVCAKLAAELPAGSVVIDYRKDLVVAHPDQFEMLESVKVP